MYVLDVEIHTIKCLKEYITLSILHCLMEKIYMDCKKKRNEKNNNQRKTDYNQRKQELGETNNTNKKTESRFSRFAS